MSVSQAVDVTMATPQDDKARLYNVKVRITIRAKDENWNDGFDEADLLTNRCCLPPLSCPFHSSFTSCWMTQ
jgi:hypothetical protein